MKKEKSNFSFKFFTLSLVCFLAWKASPYVQELIPFNKGLKLSELELDLRESALILRENNSIPVHVKRNLDSVSILVWDDQIFSINGWQLTADGLVFIEQLGELLHNFKNKSNLKILSHYDSVEIVSASKRYDITKLRSQTMSQVFNQMGFNSHQMKIKASGNSTPFLKDRDLQGNYIAQKGFLNRRLEIRIEPKEERWL